MRKIRSILDPYIRKSKDVEIDPENLIEPVSRDEIDRDFMWFLADEMRSPNCSFFTEVENTPQGAVYHRDAGDTFYVINSYDELCSVYKGQEPIPPFDFDRYTLIIGQVVENDPDYALTRTTLETLGRTYTLTLHIRTPYEERGGPFVRLKALPFWGIYPKLQDYKFFIDTVYF